MLIGMRTIKSGTSNLPHVSWSMYSLIVNLDENKSYV